MFYKKNIPKIPLTQYDEKQNFFYNEKALMDGKIIKLVLEYCASPECGWKIHRRVREVSDWGNYIRPVISEIN